MLTGSRDGKAQTPKKGGRLIAAGSLHGPSDTMDPPLFNGGMDYIRGRSYYNNLLQFNDDLSLKGDLAEEWDVSSDGLEWTFKLRKDVQFHDGSQFNADDVIYSMNRHIGEGSISKVTSLVDYMTEWKKVDSHTVKAVLGSPNVDLGAILATFHFKVVKNDAENIPGYFQLPNGTGPCVTDLGLREEMYCEMQQLARDGTGVVVPYYANYIDARSTKVRNLTEVPLGMFGGQEWPDQVWLDT